MAEIDLNELRNEIDSIDTQIFELIQRRAQLGKEIAAYKSKQPDPRFFVPERESHIIQRMLLLNRNHKVLPDKSVAKIYLEIISAIRSLECDMRVSILGPKGTFTHAAAMYHFGHAINSIFQPTIDDVFRAVEVGRADYGVVPIENSTEGMVNSTLDSLLESELKLCGEVEMRINHALISSAKKLHDVEKVLAHPQALAQCRRWLSRWLAHAELVPVGSNAEAVVSIKNDKTAAAIASEAAAEEYSVAIIQRHIEDYVSNTTRFLIIGKHDVGATGNDKTSIMMSKKSEPGSLLKLLEPFARHNINMTKIESRPSRRELWDYVFFVDIDGHASDPSITALIEELAEEASLFKNLGSYPKSPV